MKSFFKDFINKIFGRQKTLLKNGENVIRIVGQALLDKNITKIVSQAMPDLQTWNDFTKITNNI